MKVRAAIDVTCFGDEGINAVKEALLIGEKMGTKENPIEVFILSFVFLIFSLLVFFFHGFLHIILFKSYSNFFPQITFPSNIIKIVKCTTAIPIPNKQPNNQTTNHYHHYSILSHHIITTPHTPHRSSSSRRRRSSSSRAHGVPRLASSSSRR